MGFAPVIVPGERLLLLVTPPVVITIVGLGLRIGAPNTTVAALVFAAPPGNSTAGLAWQLQTFEEGHGGREAVSLPDVQVVASAGGRSARWHGATNEDGVAEAWLPLSAEPRIHVDVTAAGRVLAAGDVSVPSALADGGPQSAWARFARREGPIALDVAVLGQRVASGFPASIWVRATDAVSHVARAGITVTLEPDSSLLPSATSARTDERGWAQVIATPVGHAVTMIFDARSPGASVDRVGTWAGALFVSPGAAQIVTRTRFAPDEEPEIDIVVPTVRTTVYVEIDDVRGRAWAQVVELTAEGSAMPHRQVRAPRLSPGLYWVIAADDPIGATRLGPGTATHPFFVSASDEEALAFAGNIPECSPLARPGDVSRTLEVCLALASANPIPRTLVLDGFSGPRALDRSRRSRGLWLAIGAIVIGALLETTLLARTIAAARGRLRAIEQAEAHVRLSVGDRATTIGVALLIAMLGFVLLAAFLAATQAG